jgi:hypothetical protein
MLLSGLPETNGGLSDFVGQRLAAYSCGGSSGLGFYSRTGFPLSSGPNEPEEPRQLQLRSTAVPVNTDGDGQLPINPDERGWDSEALQARGILSGTMVLMMEASSAS